MPTRSPHGPPVGRWERQECEVEEPWGGGEWGSRWTWLSPLCQDSRSEGPWPDRACVVLSTRMVTPSPPPLGTGFPSGDCSFTFPFSVHTLTEHKSGLGKAHAAGTRAASALGPQTGFQTGGGAVQPLPPAEAGDPCNGRIKAVSAPPGPPCGADGLSKPAVEIPGLTSSCALCNLRAWPHREPEHLPCD